MSGKPPFLDLFAHFADSDGEILVGMRDIEAFRGHGKFCVFERRLQEDVILGTIEYARHVKDACF